MVPDLNPAAACDVLVIGGGLAGTMAALSAAQRGARVVMLVKGKVGESGSSACSGGIIAAAFGHTLLADETPWDSTEAHVSDTLIVGCGLCSEAHVRALAEDARDGIHELERLGVEFSKTKDGRYHQLKAPGNTRPRACSALGGGAALMRTLREQLLRHEVNLLEQILATRLLVEGGRVVGAIGVDVNHGKDVPIFSRAVVLAAGGAAGLFPTISGDSRNTGDSLILGYEAGAQLANLEFVEFTLIYRVKGKILKLGGLAPFLSRGCVLVNAQGEEFLRRYISPSSLERAVRSQILQAVTREVAAGRGPICLDCMKVPSAAWEEFERSQGPLMLKQIREAGGDYRRERIEVLPAAHSILAGLVTDPNGATTVSGLWAAGECATGVHGAARLSGNGLAACLVFGRRAGKNAAMFASKIGPSHYPVQLSLHAGHAQAQQGSINQNLRTLRQTVSVIAEESLGVIRDASTLLQARDRFRAVRETLEGLTERSDLVLADDIRHLCLIGELMASAAIMRDESRGLHFRTDVSEPKDSWQKWLVVQKNAETGMPEWTYRENLSPVIAPFDLSRDVFPVSFQSSESDVVN